MVAMVTRLSSTPAACIVHSVHIRRRRQQVVPTHRFVTYFSSGVSSTTTLPCFAWLVRHLSYVSRYCLSAGIVVCYQFVRQQYRLKPAEDPRGK